MSSLPVLVVALALAPLSQIRGAETESEPTAAERVFVLHVRPLLQDKCLGCHGGDPDNIEGGFDIRTRASLMRGGESFADEVIIAGNADKSAFYRFVSREEEGLEMPPKEADKLTPEQVRWVRNWINGGAPWPSDERIQAIYDAYASGVTVKTSGGLSEDWTNRKYEPDQLWAYKPIELPEVPENANAVDWLIDVELKKRGIAPAPPADRLTLIRRATFDLLGLPPTPNEVQSFLNDKRNDEQAFSALVDRLLESPHYGEQWGRHWLDVVRYADSSGFANDWERPNAWRYRDYVIRAFNSDKAYDDFVREQLAGDEMAEARRIAAERDAFTVDETELLVAAGFLRMGPWEHTGMSVAKITRQLFLDDITDAVGQVFLGHALQCARCHDHKFDPVPTRDYYAMQAVFATTQFAEVDAPWLESENREGMDEDRRYHGKKNDANQAMLDEASRQKAAAERKWFDERKLPYQSAFEAKRAGAPPEQIPPTSELVSPDVFGKERLGRKWQKRFGWEFDRYSPIAFTVYSGATRVQQNSARLKKPANPMKAGKLQQTFILTGGDPFAEAERVEPGVLSATREGKAFRIPKRPVGRRTALAEWIMSPENPLTARVMVNRVWQYHFGQGLAGNPNNFGATGKRPTHPRLLDWLAHAFRANGWSIKALHRTMMNTNAYRRSAQHPDVESLKQRDPNGSAYAVYVPRRLEAEELRDAMLAVSGELNRRLGGIPARPDWNLEAALQPRMIMGTFAPSYVPNRTRAQRNRRSIYAVRLRGHRDPFMETFNQPGSEKSCELRDTSTVSPQALTLFNSEESSDRALAFAARIVAEKRADVDSITSVFQSAFGRDPSDDELRRTLTFWKELTDYHEEVEPQKREFPVEVVRRATEENTGEPFVFKETLFVYADYEPDVQPAEVDARTRALSDICLAVLNSNEFIYVY